MSTDPTDADDVTAVVGHAPLDELRPRIEVGSVVGRYVVVGELGRGGMGRVLRAYDPKLQREVALKILRSPRDSEAAQRLLREAQAMARVSSPHIVAVYDVEPQDALVYIAMEYVQGPTLKKWLEEPRSRKEILDAFIEAGRGLEAAHAAGLIHRDFKPSNVLIGPDGRARVTDFGLVRARARRWSDASVESSTDEEPHDDDLTRVGSVMGTPAYMAPEQHRGAELSPQTDQYAFCVSLYEALHAQRPFAASRVEALVELKERRAVTTSRGRGVPRWLHAAVLRGLAADPSERWGSMSDLLTHLQGRSSARGAWIAVSALVVGGAASAVFFFSPRDELREACARATRSSVVAWNEAARTRVSEAFSRTDAPYAEATFARVDERLTDYVEQWSKRSTEACVQAELTGGAQQSARTRCLDERHAAARSLVELLADADEEVVRSAVSLTLELPNLDACTRAVDGDAALEEDAKAQVQEVRRRLWDVEALLHAYRSEQAARLVGELTEKADAIGYPPLQAEVAYRAGQVAEDRGEYDGARDAYERAYWTAGAHHRDELAADAARQLGGLVASQLGKPDHGLEWLRHAEMSLQRLSGDQSLRRASYLMTKGEVQTRLDHHELAEQAAREALELRQAAVGENHPLVADALRGLGNALEALERYDEAEEVLHRALRIKRAAYGEGHPTLATTMQSLGVVAAKRLDNDTAERLFTEAFELARAALGDEHPDTVAFRSNVAIMLSRADRHERALEHFEWVLQQREKTAGPEHPDFASALNNTAIANKNVGNVERAHELYERALALEEKLHGPDHPKIVTLLSNLGTLLNTQGRTQEALDHFERCARLARAAGDRQGLSTALYGMGISLSELGRPALAYASLEEGLRTIEEIVGADSSALADDLQQLAAVSIEMGEWAQARRWHERERPMVDRDGFKPTARAYFLLNEARLAAHDGVALDELEPIIQEAVAIFEAAGPLFEEDRRQAAAWLDARRRRSTHD